jgi:hypothetical protein
MPHPTSDFQAIETPRADWAWEAPSRPLTRRLRPVNLYVAALSPSNAALFAAASGSPSTAKDKAECDTPDAPVGSLRLAIVVDRRISGEFIKESCGRRTAAPQGIRSTDPRPPGIGGP